MEMSVSVGFTLEDSERREKVTNALDLFHLNSEQDYSGIPDKIKEFESRISPLLGDSEIFGDAEYYECLGGLETLRINDSSSVRLTLTTGGLGGDFASDLKRLLKRLGAKKISVQVRGDDEDDE